jgi:YD repeat-containing protein
MTYDANSRLLQAGPASFTYDASGNPLSALDATGLTSYEYDGLNQLVRSSSSAGLTQYTYDAMGHRVAKDGLRLGDDRGIETVTTAGRRTTYRSWAQRDGRPSDAGAPRPP